MDHAANYRFLEGKASLLIREEHLDTFGHMNHATYLQLYERVRWDFITDRGYGLKQCREYKAGPVILELDCRYGAEVTNRETVTITTEVTTYKGKVGNIFQQMFKEDGRLASSANFKFGLFSTERRRLVAPTEAWLAALGDKIS